MGKYKVPPGTWIEKDLFESKAFLALKGFAPQLLVLFLAKRQFEKVGRKGKQKLFCKNNDSIHFTYLEAQKKYGITQPRFTRAIDNLMEVGFIKIVHHGGAYQKDKSVYALSDDWRSWRPGEIVAKRQKETIQRGFRKPKSTYGSVTIHTNEIGA